MTAPAPERPAHTGAATAAARRAAARRRDRRRAILGVAATVAVLVLLVAILVVLRAQRDDTPAATGGERAPASDELLQALHNTSDETFAAVGTGSTTATVRPTEGQPLLSAGGKPEVFYVGTEYCPFCAGQRWPLIMALSRFGEFTALPTTMTPGEGTADIPTFSFSGDSYTSEWVTFTGVETYTAKRVGNSYEPLDRLTAAQEDNFATFNAPPYTQTDGAVPFLNIGNQFLQTGASFDISVLFGRTQEDVAASLADPSSDTAKAVLGSANVMTAAICQTIDNAAPVCDQPLIRQIQDA